MISSCCARLVLVCLAQGARGVEVLPGEPFERRAEPVRRALAELRGTLATVHDDGLAAALEELERALEDPEPAPQAERLFAPGFEARVPAPWEFLPEGASLRARRAAPATSVALGATAFLGWVRAPFGVARELSAEVQRLADPLTTSEGTDEWLARVRLVLAGRGALGARTLELELDTAWRAAPDGRARLVRLEVLTLAEACGAPRFRDATEEVFGPSGAWEQLAPGLAHWRERLDARLGLSLSGLTGGLAVGDVDDDGREDLYLGQPGGLPNRLFLNEGRAAREVAAEAGVDFLDPARGALLIDLDGDGDRDLCTGAGERLLVCANDGRGRFWLAGAVRAPHATSLAAADVDRDGDLDLYTCASASPFEHDAAHGSAASARDRLLENRGAGSFVDASEARLAPARAFGLAAAFEDYDADGDPDLCVARELGAASLYANEDGRLREAGAELGPAEAAQTTGVAWGDADDDGDFDLLLSGARASRVFENRGGGSLRALPGALDGWAFGGLFFDLDGRAPLDVLLPGGFLSAGRAGDLASAWHALTAQLAAPEAATEALSAQHEALQLLLRRGEVGLGRAGGSAQLALERGAFVDVSPASGFTAGEDGRALVRVDWDGDGDLDLFLSQRVGPSLRYFEGVGEGAAGTLTLELRTRGGASAAVGARVELELRDADGRLRALTQAVRAGEGFLAQSTARLVFALGEARPERARVRWPGGPAEEFVGLEKGGLWLLELGTGRAQRVHAAQDVRPTSPRAVAGDSELALAAPRVVLARPVPLPRMELVDEEGRALALFGLTAGGTGTGTGRIVLLVPFSSAMPATLENLERLARAAAELGRAGIAPLALSLDGAAGAVAAGAALRARGWQHPWASATPEALERLDALQALLLDHERRLALPASFLVDPSGALRVLYTGAVDAQRVLAHRELCALADGAELEAAVPFPGRWMFPEIPSDADFFEGRLRARGLDGAAAEFARGRLTLVRSAPADLLHEFGREAALAGRFDDAQKFFQRALAADPRHFRALSDWAVVLHRGGELALAAELYGKALALDPEHADTRFNLALALLGLGDRAGAENQLRWLQARKVESAAVLERALRELTAPK